MKQQTKKIDVLMVGPTSSVKGGIRTVVKQYLAYNGWKEINLRYIPTHVEGSILKKSLFFLIQYTLLCLSCLAHKPDIVHMHVSERGSFWRKMIILRTCQFLGMKTVLHHHGAEFFLFYDKASEKNKHRIARTISGADVNLVLSNYHFELMKKQFPQGNFKVIYNGIIPEAGVYNPYATGILFVGRLGERKGIYDLIDAIEQIDGSLPSEIQLFFCGDGDINHVSRVLSEKNLLKRVAHIGWCDKKQLLQFYGQSMLFILPSYNEGLPMSLLEAMYAGLPCISTKVAGIPEVLKSGVNGILVEPGNLDQIKDSILQLMQDKELRKRFGSNAHDMVRESFLIRSHVRVLEEVYVNLEGNKYV